MYSNRPNEQQKTLFGLTGVNVASCFQDPKDGKWYFSSRELMYYLDPNSEEMKPLDTWLNPWTNETVRVVHVANSPVQAPFGFSNDTMPVTLLGKDGSVTAQSSDYNLFYPNVL